MNEPALLRALRVLAPVLPELVVVGGTAHRLFPLHELGSEPEHALLTTEDIDLALPLELGHRGPSDVLERLLSAGFVEELRGANEQATSIYHVRGLEPAYVQFIAPQRGSGEDRAGRPDRLLRVGGITAEKLRDVELLLHDTWILDMHTGEGTSLSVRVVSPVAFLLQKLLVMQRSKKRGKHLLYVHDTLEIFSERLDELAATAGRLAPALKPSQAQRARRVVATHCHHVTDVAREAAKIAAGQRPIPPSAEQLARACTLGLGKLLDPLLGP